MSRFLFRLVQLVLGLFLFAAGIVVTIQADIGYGPWEVFHVGLGKTLGISMGAASILVGFLILIGTFILGERIGLGTILNMILIGVFIDLIMAMEVIPRIGNLYGGIPFLILGLFIVSFGSFFYIRSGFGAGPRDGLMVALKRRTRLPVGAVRAGIELSATVIGWFLGGLVGVGSVITALGIGLCIQATFRLLKFDPTAIRHSSLADSFKEVKALAWNNRN